MCTQINCQCSLIAKVYELYLLQRAYGDLGEDWQRGSEETVEHS